MDSISNSLQENLLVLLCFDQSSLPILANSLKEEYFESAIYKDISRQAINYWLEYKKPIAEHLPDVFDHVLSGTDDKKADIYGHTIQNIYDAKDSVNPEYILNQIEKFVRGQNLKLGLKESVECLQKNDLDGAEAALDRNRKQQLTIFNPGTQLTDLNKSLKFLFSADEVIHTGIKALDNIGVCPAPKELLTIAALKGKGKTWALIHIAKFALRQRKKVLHITLEMSEEKISGRYMQSLFGIAKNQPRREYAIFRQDDTGRLSDIDFATVDQQIASFNDPNISQVLKRKLERLRKPQLIIKEFPTGQLTIPALRAYIESLEYLYNFIPDILIVDYADLMHLNKDNIRIETGRVYTDIRGLAVEKCMAAVTASQINRAGEDEKLITSKHLSEDFSKAMISDNVLIYNQTREEYELGLARFYVDKARNDRTGDIILMSQNYSIGQFCLDSALIKQDRYWNILQKSSGNDDS